MHHLIAGLAAVLWIVQHHSGLCQVSQCDLPWIRNGTRCYKLHSDTLRKSSAETQCKNMLDEDGKLVGAKLAYSRSPEDDAFLSDIIPQSAANVGLWLGTNLTNGEWTNSDGSKATYVNWASHPKECPQDQDWKDVTDSPTKCYLFVLKEVQWHEAKSGCVQAGKVSNILHGVGLAVINPDHSNEITFFKDYAIDRTSYDHYWAKKTPNDDSHQVIARSDGGFYQAAQTELHAYVCGLQVDCVALTKSTKEWKIFNLYSAKRFACYQDIPATPAVTSDPPQPALGDHVVLTCRSTSGRRFTFYKDSAQIQNGKSNTYDIPSVGNGVYTCVASLTTHIHSEQSSPWSLSGNPDNSTTSATTPGNSETTQKEDQEEEGSSNTAVVAAVVSLCVVAVIVTGVVAAFWVFVIRRRKAEHARALEQLRREKMGDEAEAKEEEASVAPTAAEEDRSIFQAFKDKFGFSRESNVDTSGKTESGTLSGVAEEGGESSGGYTISNTSLSVRDAQSKQSQV